MGRAFLVHRNDKPSFAGGQCLRFCLPYGWILSFGFMIMGKRLPPFEMELYRRTDEVLHYIWDPIGISGVPEARDEYYSYLPKIFKMLASSTDGKDIADYLIFVEHEMMGLSIKDKARERANEVADILLNYREYIKEKAERQL